MARQKVISNKRKQKTKPDLLRDILQLIEMGLNMAVTIYLFLMIVVIPFYYTDGYAKIGSDKYQFFYKGTCGAGIVFMIFAFFYPVVRLCIMRRDKEIGRLKAEIFRIFKSISVTDWFVLGYGVIVVLSYLCSDYKTDTDFGNAFEGVDRWFMGMRTQLFLVAVYFAVSRCWNKRKWLPVLSIPVTFVVFVLGYINRFGVRPFEMKNTTVAFISTIGNINWYCGYIVIPFFGILYYFWSMSEKKTWQNIVLGIWMTAGYGTLVTQGSRSGLVTLVVMMLVLYLISMKKVENMLVFFFCCICLGFICTLTYGFRYIWAEHFNYSDGLVDLLTNSPLAFVILGGAIFVYLLITFLKKKGKSLVKVFTLLGYVACGIACVSLVTFVVLGVVNTRYPGSLGGLSEVSALKFDLHWGSYRGATWAAGVQCFVDQDFVGKLLGVGPDSMAMYIQSGANPALLTMKEECFGGSLLTNAHCEWLTVLVNNGLLGMICYVGLFVTAIVRCFRAGKDNAMAGACGFAILAYTINNLFSFQQALSAVTIFIVLGMGEAFVREKVQKKNN
ncbi:MAG: O-antigen ligase family protein [Lachnospiraceae bacterium]|nr:O-antigen ligase family protein [Lachnospiraceae bacterium]